MREVVGDLPFFFGKCLTRLRGMELKGSLPNICNLFAQQIAQHRVETSRHPMVASDTQIEL